MVSHKRVKWLDRCWQNYLPDTVGSRSCVWALSCCPALNGDIGLQIAEPPHGPKHTSPSIRQILSVQVVGCSVVLKLLKFKLDLGAEVHSTVPTLPYSPRVQLPCFDFLINKQIMKKLEGTEQTPVGTCLITGRQKSLSKAISSAFMSSESAQCLGEAADLF